MSIAIIRKRSVCRSERLSLDPNASRSWRLLTSVAALDLTYGEFYEPLSAAHAVTANV